MPDQLTPAVARQIATAWISSALIRLAVLGVSVWLATWLFIFFLTDPNHQIGFLMVHLSMMVDHPDWHPPGEGDRQQFSIFLATLGAVVVWTAWSQWRAKLSTSYPGFMAFWGVASAIILIGAIGQEIMNIGVHHADWSPSLRFLGGYWTAINLSAVLGIALWAIAAVTASISKKPKTS